VDGPLLCRFAAAERDRLRDSVVRRAVALADGLLLVLQRGGAEFECGFASAPGAAWVWDLGASGRDALLNEIAPRDAGLTQPAAALGWADPAATPLDALRAWLLRPAPQPPGWAHLEGCRLVDLEPRGGDRILDVRFEKSNALGRPERLQLAAELFDRAPNWILTDAAGSPLANASGRPPAEARSSRPPAHDDTAPDAGAPSLLARAHLGLATACAAQLATLHRRGLRRRETRLATLLDKLGTERGTSESAESWRRLGELLSANLHRVRRGQSRVTVEDFFADGAPRDIDLDPQLSPQENAALFFKRARRGARGLPRVQARHAETAAALAEVRAALQGLEAVAGWADTVRAAAETWRATCGRGTAAVPVAALWRPGGGAKLEMRRAAEPNDAPQGPGRRFVLAGGWEVRVGRSNTENDALTHRFAAPDDVWLHAGGAAGSHVVLRMQGRSGNPPRDVLEAAAAIAAHFSKARHAGTVPVIWTRKRWVRKPRGGKPGLATCTHEKTVFVRPGLPRGDEAGDPRAAS
jgi:hypothetical protein